MEKQFSSFVVWLTRLKQKLFKHRLAKTISPKIFRLGVIVVITMAIPLTVLGVQQVREIRQQAAEPSMNPGDYGCSSAKPCCDGSNGMKVEPLIAKTGQTITFSFTTGESMIGADENETGNAAKECSYNGSTLTCRAQANEKGSKNYSKSTWTFLPTGDKCEYIVLKSTDNKARPKNPAKGNPNHTPVPGKPTSTPKPNEGFDADIEADGCNASGYPRLKVKWDTSSGKNDCKITLEGGGQKEERTGCTDESFVYDALPRNSQNKLKSTTPYTVTVRIGSQEKKVSATTASCTTKATPVPPTPGRGGQPQPTQKPANPGTTGKGTCANGKGVFSIQGFCDNDKKALLAIWDIPEVLGKDTCNIFLRGGVGDAPQGLKNCKGTFTITDTTNNPLLPGASGKLVVSNGDPDGGCYNVESSEATLPTSCAPGTNQSTKPSPTRSLSPTPTLNPKNCDPVVRMGQQAGFFDPRCPEEGTFLGISPTPKPTVKPTGPPVQSPSPTPTPKTTTPPSGKKPTPVFYWQGDPKWDNGCAMRASGCGPTTMAMILSSFGDTITPKEMDAIFRQRRTAAGQQWRSCGGPSYMEDAIAKYLPERGYTYRKLNTNVASGLDLAQAQEYLDKDSLIIGSTNGEDTGHIFMLTKTNAATNEVFLFDPALWQNAGGVWRPNKRPWNTEPWYYAYAVKKN